MTVAFRKVMFLVAAISFLAPVLAVTEEPQIELKQNPFARPAAEELMVATVSSNEGLAAGRAPGLRAVLVAGSKSAVNIDGVILQVGECSNAYCLLAVEEGNASVSKDGEKIVLSLYDQEQSEER